MTDEPTVVASSLSAAYVAAAEDVSATEFVLICPTATTIPGQRTWLRSLLRSPVVGEGLYNLLTSKPSIRYFLADHGFANAASIPDEWVEYDWRTAHQPSARFAPASFIGGFLDLDVDLGERLAETYHVVAPDLPGFGHSDRPPLLYSGSLYVALSSCWSRRAR
ncbi:hypothetical protein BRC63_11075 [Halobacteriales archaeon QH_10_70_21]|nr:MAG: hypothetical protein BRC63_11075 [Halobacteriales archaeon QH_10_70_21]